MDAEAFFKGVEVGRSLRGWREPDASVPIVGTKHITSNGLYDVADYATASVDVTVKDEADAAQIRAVMQYEWFSFAAFSPSPGFSVTVSFLDVDEDEDGYATNARWRCALSNISGYNSGDEYLAYIFTQDMFSIPGLGNKAMPGQILGAPRSYLEGDHVLTFTSGLTGADPELYKIHIEGETLPNIHAQIFTGSLGQDGYASAVSLTGEGWSGYSGAWAGYFDFNVRL